MPIDPKQIVQWIIVGAIAGSVAGMLIRGRRQFLVVSIVIGLIGAFVGGLIFNLLKFNPNWGTLEFTGRDFVAAIVGAMIFLILIRALRPRIFR